MALGPVSAVPIPTTLQKASQVTPSQDSDLSSDWAPIPLNEALRPMQGSQARESHAAILRAIPKWATNFSRQGGRFSAGNFWAMVLASNLRKSEDTGPTGDFLWSPFSPPFPKCI
jgi:hypothetical protein